MTGQPRLLEYGGHLCLLRDFSETNDHCKSPRRQPFKKLAAHRRLHLGSVSMILMFCEYTVRKADRNIFKKLSIYTVSSNTISNLLFPLNLWSKNSSVLYVNIHCHHQLALHLPSNPLVGSCSLPQWLLLFHRCHLLPGYFLLQFPTEKQMKPLLCYAKRGALLLHLSRALQLITTSLG